MPVPVPKKQPAHTVCKPVHIQDGQTNLFSSLTATLPVSPAGPPPSFGTREEWISSLPSWRRAKPRQSWSDHPTQFNQFFLGPGLAIAGNAQAIKGSHAQASQPPSTGMHKYHPASQMDVDHPSPFPDYLDYERGAFTPVFEDQSPIGTNHDDESSPLEPVTPFGQLPVSAALAAFTSGITDKSIALVPSPAKVIKHEPVQEVVTPTATSGYRKLAGPLSEWVANFIWRACTDRSNANMTRSMMENYHPSSPPSSLASSIHSLLLSTLLQPSAVFLALWYIARLPTSFIGQYPGPEQIKETHFRRTLLGDETILDREMMEANAPFRLAVVGCMLANKWLDDHTFSNKTWHTISNVPIRLLNRLESLALDIFDYDLSVPPADWSYWLAHLFSQHTHLSSPMFPEPIGRPSASPQAIVRKTIDEIIQARVHDDTMRPQPVFLNVEERRRERLEREQAACVAESALSDINLDEDGPLREEYLPKKYSTAGPGSITRIDYNLSKDENTVLGAFTQDTEKNLPPPAKWSPAGDEPILRDCNRVNGHYVAVQPPAPAPQFQVLATYQRRHDIYSIGGWPLPQPSFSMGHYFDIHVPAAPAMHVAPPVDTVYTSYQPMPPIAPPSHSRSQSLSAYAQTTQQRARSFSQVNSAAPQWPFAQGQYDVPYSQSVMGFPSFYGLGVGHHQPTWLRA